jgi:hypothetical protein
LEASTLQCADIGGSWSNATVTCTVSGTGAVPPGVSLEIDLKAGLVIGEGATFNNSGIIEDNGSITVSGTLTNNFGAIITVSGTLTNNSGGSITNDGEFTNDSSGITINSGALSNTAGGTISNSRDFYNLGAIANSGAFASSCLVRLDESGTFTSVPPVSCGSTSASSQSASAGPSSNHLDLDAALVVVVIVALALVLLRGGIKKK